MSYPAGVIGGIIFSKRGNQKTDNYSLVRFTLDVLVISDVYEIEEINPL